MSLRSSLCLCVCAITLLSACDRLGLPDPAKEAAQKEADARATGSACRHSGRAIEDCYAMNPDASRAAVYSGWKEMNDYMRENKIDTVKPEKEMEAQVKMAESASASASSASTSASSSASASSKSSKK